MATYIPNITDVFPEPYIFKPDLAFYDKMLQRKTALYEQGVAKARSAREAVLNAPLTNTQNIEIRDQYIKQATENLKKLAGADFSQPQNIAAATSIFSPFWEDKFIMQDANYTKAYQNEFGTLNRWKNSDDPKVRENYSGIAEAYLNNGLSVLANADRTDDGFSKIEKRKAVPFTNLQKYLNEAAEKDPEKLKIQWDDPQGVYMMSTINGKRSKKPFAEWARAQLGNNFYEQFRVTGVVEHENKVKLYRQNFPNLTDQEINQKIADDHIDETDKFFQKRKDVINTEIARINGVLAAMPKVLTDENKEAVRQYLNERARLSGDLAEVDKEYQVSSEKNRREELRSNIVIDPKGFFTLLAKERVVENFAAGRSSIESRKITANEGFVKAFDIQEKNRRYELDVLKEDRDWIKKQWDMTQGGAGNKGQVGVNSQGQPIDKDGNVITETTGVDTQTGGQYIGMATTAPLNVATAAENWVNGQKNLFLGIYDNMFSADGLLQLVKKGVDLTDADMMYISSALRQEMRSDVFNPGAPPYKFTPEQKAATDKLTKFLQESKYVKEAGIKITGPRNLGNALLAYTKGMLTDRKTALSDGKDYVDLVDDNEINAVFNYYQSAVDGLNRYMANENNRNKMLSDYAKSNPEDVKKYFVKKDDGTYDLLTPEVLAKDMPELSFSSTKLLSNEKVNLSKLDAARLYLSGKLNIRKNIGAGDSFTMISPNTGEETQYQLTSINGKTQKTARAFGDRSNLMETEIEKVFLTDLKNKYGYSSDFAENYNKIYQSAVPNLLYNQGKTGQIGAQFSYTFSKDKEGAADKAFATFTEALNPSNTTMYLLDADKNFTQADAETVMAITNMLQGKEKDAEQYVGGFLYNAADGRVGGKPSIQFTLGAIAGTSKLETGNKSLTDLAKNTYVLAIKDTERMGSNLKSLPRNTGFYMYEDILRGKQVKSDPILSLLGYEYTVTPDFDGSDPNQKPTRVRVSLKYPVRENAKDPQTGEYKSNVTIKTQNVVYDLSRKTPDEIIEDIQTMYKQTMSENQMYKKQYDDFLLKQSKSGQSSLVDKDEFIRSLGF